MDRFIWLIALLIIVAVAGFAFTRYQASEVEKDSLELVKQKIADGAKVFDVRTPEEYAEFHYPGAININVTEIESRIAEFGPPDQPVIVYCRSGRRSTRAKRLLEEAGYTDVLNAGGLEDIRQLLP